MNTSSAGRLGPLASIFGEEPGTERQERRGLTVRSIMRGPMLAGLRRLEGEEERQLALVVGRQPPAPILALDEQGVRPQQEVHLLEEFDTQAGGGQRRHDLP